RGEGTLDWQPRSRAGRHLCRMSKKPPIMISVIVLSGRKLEVWPSSRRPRKMPEMRGFRGDFQRGFMIVHQRTKPLGNRATNGQRQNFGEESPNIVIPIKIIGHCLQDSYISLYRPSSLARKAPMLRVLLKLTLWLLLLTSSLSAQSDVTFTLTAESLQNGKSVE